MGELNLEDLERDVQLAIDYGVPLRSVGLPRIRLALARIRELESRATDGQWAGVPEGYVVVPVKVTPEMRAAWDSAPVSEDDDDDFRKAYAAMLAAAPTPQADAAEFARLQSFLTEHHASARPAYPAGLAAWALAALNGKPQAATGAQGQHDVLAELDWCIGNGCYGPRTEKVLQQVRAILAQAAPSVLSAAARDVLAERQRQITAEGWTPEHDDQHIPGALAQAAACYIEWNGWESEFQREGAIPINWPWAAEWWKPSDDRRNLEKAGALILAEIERLDRAALAEGSPSAEATATDQVVKCELCDGKDKNCWLCDGAGSYKLPQKNGGGQ